MDKFLSLVISGTVTGGIYSIMASGLVLTYTTSGIFNFAQGAIAFAVAYFYYQLNSGGMPIVPAAILSILIFAPLMGFALDRLLLRRLGEAPVYAKVVGTIGLLVAIPNFMQWVVVTLGNGVFHAGWVANKADNQGLSTPGLGPTPAKVFHVMQGVALTSDQLAVFVAALVSAAVLWFVLRHTRIGLEMRAVVDRRHLAGLKGVSASRTSAVAWVLTTVLAGLGGILISPLFTLDPIVFTLVVLGSLAAVVLGGLRSIPIAFVGGVLLGVVQNLVAGYSTAYPGFIANLNGLSSAVPYVLVILLGLIIGRDRSRQAGSVAEDRPPSDHRAGMSLPRRWWPWVTFLFILVGYSLHWFPSWFQATSTAQTAIAQGLSISIILLSFIVVTGMGGMVSLAQATFVTAGGFAAGWALNRNWGINIPLIASHGQLNFFWAVVIGAIVAGVIGALIAWPATRLGAVYLAIWSLAACLFFSLVPFDTQAIGNGQAGWNIRSPALDLFGWRLNFANLNDQILLFIGVFGLITGVIWLFTHSATGRATLAVRSSPTAAMAAGIRANRNRILVFALAAGIAGIGGVMLSLFSFAASNSTAPPLEGLTWLAFVVVFGVRRPGGALLAGLAVAAGSPLLNQLTNWLPGQTVNTLISSPYFLPILFGMGAISLAQEPDGILALRGGKKLAKRRARTRASRRAGGHSGRGRSAGGPVGHRHRGRRRLRTRSRPHRTRRLPRCRPGCAGRGGRLRRCRGAPRGRPRAACGRDRRPARGQRRRQVVAVRRHCRTARTDGGQCPPRRRGPVRVARLPTGPCRSRPGARGPWHLPRTDGRGEPDPRLARREGPAAGLCPLSRAGRTPTARSRDFSRAGNSRCSDWPRPWPGRPRSSWPTSRPWGSRPWPPPR